MGRLRDRPGCPDAAPAGSLRGAGSPPVPQPDRGRALDVRRWPWLQPSWQGRSPSTRSSYDAAGHRVVLDPVRPALRDHQPAAVRCDALDPPGELTPSRHGRPSRPGGYHCHPVTIAPNDFTHLHVHSEFSLLDGLGRITELVDAAAQAGMDSMAITDHGALYGAVAFYQAAKNHGHQADHRRGDVRRPPLDDLEGGQGRRPAVPPDPAREGLPRLPEPVPPRHRRPRRWLLLQAAHRPRPPREVQRGAHRAVGVPRRRGRQGARGRRLGAGAQGRRHIRRHLRQGRLLPGAAGSRPGRAAPAERAAACASPRRPACRSS